jgi:hypothetical protein
MWDFTMTGAGVVVLVSMAGGDFITESDQVAASENGSAKGTFLKFAPKSGTPDAFPVE